MCTVSYIKIKNGFILTSNRDELVSRPTLAPAYYNESGNTLLFPKDELAYGSWVACNKQGQVACLLNGAFAKHKRQLPYNKSRGAILLESFSYNSVPKFLEKVNLFKVEPFTLIIANNESLTELKWDGIKKHVLVLKAKDNHIWSSATLYPQEVSVKKEGWFKKWMTKHALEEDRNIYKFHSSTHGTIPSQDVLSRFTEELKTISITQLTVSEEKTSMTYHDLVKGKTHHANFKGLINHV